MVLGRNQICTCGSGRKYKHCCLNKIQTTQVQELYDEDSESDDILSFRSTFQGLLFNMHNYKLKKLSHVREYKRLRKIHREIITSMAKYHDQGKFSHEVSAADGMESTLKAQSPKQLRKQDIVHLIDIEYDLETYEGVNAYYDSFIYKMASNVNSITEDFISSKRYRKPEKLKMLESMHNSICGLFEIADVDSEQGYVWLKNIFTSDVYRIIDIGMSLDSSKTDIYVYRRLITFDEITFTAGTPLTFNKSDPFIIKFIKHHKKNWLPHGEFLRFNELYNHYTTSEKTVIVKRNEF
jgi:hypothetical protein